MPVIARTIGGPGAGKTHRLLEILDKVLKTVVSDPMRVGFVSFTRVARRVASSRAADKFGLTAQELERQGWFRTLHSTAFRCLGLSRDEVLAGSEDDNKWLKNVLGDDKAGFSRDEMDDDQFNLPAQSGDSNRALALWAVARNRLCPLSVIWEESNEVDDRLPPLDLCENVVTLYERAKLSVTKLDFPDMLMRYAGVQWSGSHERPFTDVEPQGIDPGLPVWMLDECQDQSPLSWKVAHRLVRFSSFAYLVGDQWQSIYQWAGCDGSLFMNAQASKEECLPISYRCRQNILDFADEIMVRGGHKKRPFVSKDQGGEVTRVDLEIAMSRIKTDEDTLVLARTNDYAKQCERLAEDLGLPWVPTKGGGGFNAPAKADGVAALVRLRQGGTVVGYDIKRIMELLPSKAAGTELFIRGAKKYYEDAPNAHESSPLKLADMDEAGATEAFKHAVSSGRYVDILDAKPAQMARCAERHGIDAMKNPKLKIGTCHSAKGAEADNVIAVNQIPYPTQRAIEEEEGLDQERRLWFTTASRARHRLTIAEGRGQGFPDL